MKEPRTLLKKQHLLVFFVTLVAAASIVTFTIGRDIYMGKTPSFFSFSATHFAGYLFFLLMPVEVAYIYCLSQNGSPVLMMTLALSTATLAHLIDYYIGYWLGTRFVERFVSRERYLKAERQIITYGKPVLLLFTLFPLSSPILILAAGLIHYPIKDVLIYSFTGLFFKYLFITLFLV